MTSVSDYIKLSADEEIIREYKGFRMIKPQNAALTIAVTSKRLIMYAMTSSAAKKNRPSFTQDMRIDDIRGVEVYEKHKTSIPIAILGLIITVVGIYGVAKPYTGIFYDIYMHTGYTYIGGAMVALIGLIILLSGICIGSKMLSIDLKSKQNNADQCIKDTILLKWSGEAQRVLCELGSLIIDVQEKYLTISPVAAAKASAGYTYDDYSDRESQNNGCGCGYGNSAEKPLTEEDFMSDSTPSAPMNQCNYASYYDPNANFNAPPPMPPSRMNEQQYVEQPEAEAQPSNSSNYEEYPKDQYEEEYEEEPTAPVNVNKPQRSNNLKDTFSGSLGLLEDANVHLPPLDDYLEDDDTEPIESNNSNNSINSEEEPEEEQPKRDDYLF